MPVEQIAERFERAGEPLAPRAGRRQYRVHRRPEVVRQLPDERSEQLVAAEALPPQSRARPPRHLGDPLQGQAAEAALAENLDRRLAKRLVHGRRPLAPHLCWRIHAT